MPRSAEDRAETEELDGVTGDDEDSVEQFFVPRTGAAGVEKDEEEGEDAEANEGEVDDVERGHRVFLHEPSQFRLIYFLRKWKKGIGQEGERKKHILFHWQSTVL